MSVLSGSRNWLAVLIVAFGLIGHGAIGAPAFAKDGGEDHSGSDDKGGDDGGGDDHGGEDSGDDHSGPGSGEQRDNRPSAGSSDDGRWDHSSPGEARTAVASGKVLSLGKVLKTVRGKVPGVVLNVDLYQPRPGAWVYKVLVLARDGKYREVVVDARRNSIVRVRTR